MSLHNKADSHIFFNQDHRDFLSVAVKLEHEINLKISLKHIENVSWNMFMYTQTLRYEIAVTQ